MTRDALWGQGGGTASCRARGIRRQQGNRAASPPLSHTLVRPYPFSCSNCCQEALHRVVPLRVYSPGQPTQRRNELLTGDVTMS